MSRKLRLLTPEETLTEPGKHRPFASLTLIGYQALWHPSLLAETDELPTRVAPDEVRLDDAVLAIVPEPLLEKIPPEIREALGREPHKLLVVTSEHVGLDGPDQLLEPLGLPTGDDDQLRRDFYAFAYAYLGLYVLFVGMEHDDQVDGWAVLNDMQSAAEAYVEGNVEQSRGSLQAAFDFLLNGRQLVYPATINLLDLALYSKQWQVADLEKRVDSNVPFNLIATGAEIEAIAGRDDGMLEKLKSSLEDGSTQLLGGPYDERPWSLLSHESRMWQLDRSSRAYEATLGREVDCFGARKMALAPELPQLLMKFHYQFALHVAFDSGTWPHFRDPKVHWTAPDGSSVDALARVACNAGDPDSAFVIFDDLARSLLDDRTATLPFAHWVHRPAFWFDLILRIDHYAPVFGRFDTFTDFFLNSMTSERPSQTQADEYLSGALKTSAAKGDELAVSRWTKHHQRRGVLETARAFEALSLLAGRDEGCRFDDLEDRIEESCGEPEGDLEQALGEARTSSLNQAVDALLDDAPEGRGILVINPTSYPRRTCFEIEEKVSPSWEGPVRASQPTERGTALIVDVPGWGYTWVPADDAKKGKEETAKPIASGRKLRNERIEVEIDKKTGTIRGIWQPRSGYNRLAQELVHSAGSRSICTSLTITENGPALGEITSKGELLASDGQTRWATFTQRTRLWAHRSFVEVAIELEPVGEVKGDATNYVASRWTWGDEKTPIAVPIGYCLDPSYAAEIESPLLLHLPERHLSATIAPKGLPFHRRINAQQADTLLLVAGERERQFEFTLGIDLPLPWTAAYESLWPIGIKSVTKGPPSCGTTASLAKLHPPSIVGTRLLPGRGEETGIELRLAETQGESRRASLTLGAPTQSACLTNGRGELVFQVDASSEALSLDFSSFEYIQLEARLKREHASGEDESTAESG
ncbi:hypothetical protein Pan216_49950 [Planctomycetes bacterium Pan216]|uniref:Glycoside hydrolase family 38 N-terminal domain-containing protein n=1 Tax=Kolteria novifilia TaxID=2527975 RepID=A0A518BAU8_9BACT|nr:hypothetical protein Pan216_49950 [Planctomycetes bacterium Pan216]